MTLPIKILPVVALVVGTAAPAFADSMTTWVPPGGGAIAASMLASGAAAANLGFTPLNPANNLSELSNAASARASLGFGSLLPNLSASVEGTGLPGLDGGHWFIWNNPGTYDPNVTLRVDRRISSGSGASGGTNKAIWGYSSTNPANQGYEWTITGQQDNTANASTGAQNVAVAGYIFKQVPTNTAATISASGTGSTATVTFAGGATIPVGHSALIAGVTPTGYNGTYKVTASASGSISFASTATGAQTVAGTIVDVSVSGSWGMNGSCEDKTADVNPVAPCLGAEFDVTADSATTDTGRQRVGLQVVGSGPTGAHIGRGVFMQSGAGAIIDRAYDFTGSFGIGLDFTGGAFSTSPIVLAAGQKICLESSCSYTISDQAGVIYISTPSGNVISMSAAGAISATSTVNASGYSVSGTAGFTGTKTAGSCVFTINGGIITNVTGC